MPIVYLTTNLARAVFTPEFILNMSVLMAHLMKETPKVSFKLFINVGGIFGALSEKCIRI
jgi:hypothetical protein